MLYVDTSAIVKLYVREDYSQNVSAWLRENDQAIPWTAFHELEFTNAVHLKEFREEITSKQSRLIKTSFTEHEERGVYFRPELAWAEAFGRAIDLTTQYTARTGARSLDILHVASALLLGADTFLTFDERQSQLAARERLRIVQIP